MEAAPSPDGGATDIIHTLQSRHLLPCDVQRRGRGCNAEGRVGWWAIIHSFIHSSSRRSSNTCQFLKPSPALCQALDPGDKDSELALQS